MSIPGANPLSVAGADAVSPVTQIPSDAGAPGPSPGIALCLSGGGYRAMLFHVGGLWRLNEAGYLRKLDRVSSVSGGSITAGVLGLNWSKLAFDGNGVAAAFAEQLVGPIRKFAGRTIDVGSVLGGLLLPGSISDKVRDAYREYLFGRHTLQNLPPEWSPERSDGQGPRFIFNATNVQTGVLWRFSRPYMGDYRVGLIPHPDVELAVAVAASSAFPPVLSPLTLDVDPHSFTPGSGTDLQHEPYTTSVILSDGGVYDNLGLETAWKRYQTILVSDAGGKEGDEPDPEHDWVRHSVRILGLIDNQVRSLRKRQVIQSYVNGTRTGAYWGIRTNIADYGLQDALPCPVDKTMVLALTATRLQRLDEQVQERLINWGYAVCDAALRRHVDPSIPRPVGFPYQAEGVG